MRAAPILIASARVSAFVSALVLAACAAVVPTLPLQREAGDAVRAREVLAQSFVARGQAGLDRLQPDEAQRLCSEAEAAGVALAPEVAAKIQQDNLAQVRYPAAGAPWQGDWRAGERIAQSGVGRQWSDPAEVPSGGNCYACHQLSPDEMSYGTLGPSLLGYGRLREAMPRADLERMTWTRIANPQAMQACSRMPRFGTHGILTEQQIRDVMALLLAPDSPVNRPAR
jgi:sulfur-oxidizing protein SoxX